MFCMKCGKKIDDDSKFCPFCGSAIGDTTQSNEQTQRMSMSSQIPSMSAVKAVKKPISKNAVIGVAACLVAVLAVIGVIKLFTGGFGKTFAEQLFQMSWEEAAELFDEEELKSALCDAKIDIDYEENLNVLYCNTKSASQFMCYDCYLKFNFFGFDDAYSVPFQPEFDFVVACETEKEYKNAKDDILKYFNKNLVKGYDVKTVDLGDDVEAYIYLVDISTDGLDKFKERAKSEWFVNEFGEDTSNEVQETLKDCKVYKFTRVVFVGDYVEDYNVELIDALSFDIEDCPEYGYVMRNYYIPLTDEEFKYFIDEGFKEFDAFFAK